MSAKLIGKGFFSIKPGDNPYSYIDEKKKEIESMTSREKLVSQTLLLIGQTLAIIIGSHDLEAFEVLEQQTGKLFVEGRSILEQGVDKVQ